MNELPLSQIDATVVYMISVCCIKEKDIPYKYRDHAWFTCFAPAENPEIAVTVLVEHGMHGGSGAAPVARAVLEAYFGERIKAGEDINVQIIQGGVPSHSNQATGQRIRGEQVR